MRDGWGTRFVVAVRTGIRATADPSGMTTRKTTAVGNGGKNMVEAI
jgi:hypothetical protein